MTSGTKRNASQMSSNNKSTRDTNEAVENPSLNPSLNPSHNLNNDNCNDNDEYVELPFYGEHIRAVSAIAFAPTMPSPSSSSYGPSKSFSYTAYPAANNQTYALCASASADGTVRLWDIQKSDVEFFLNSSSSTPEDDDDDNDNDPNDSKKNPQLMTPTVCLSGHSRGVNDVCWSPRTAEIIATASDDKTLRIFDVTRGSGPSQSVLDSIHSPTANNPGPNPDSNSNPDQPNSNSNSNSNPNNYLLNSPTTSSSTQYNSNSQTLQGETLVEFKGHSNFCFSVAFSPQGNLLVSGSFDETVKLWDVRSGECVATLPAHSDPVTGVDFNRDGTCIVSSSHDGLIRIWDVSTGECLKTIYAEGNPPVTFVKYSPNGKFILSGTLDGKLRLWNVAGNFATMLDRNGASVGSVGGGGGASGGAGGVGGAGGSHGHILGRSNSNSGLGISTAQGRGGQCTKTYYGGHVNSKYCIFSAFNVSNLKRQSIVTGSEDGNVYVYDLQTRNVKQVLKNAHSDACLAVAAHDSKELLASGGMSNDKTVRFWIPKSILI
mmetsp:Transcript_26346/g.39489  ORF Transcript_26346/g.39489 Transcript_26346/m.39489 type:complete len:546 (-) Transcript_26346:86-1723(-)